MCKSSSCCHGSTSSGGVIALAAAVVAVTGAAALLESVLLAVALAALVLGLGAVSFAVWRVRVLTRPERPAVRARTVPRAISAPPKAIEAPKSGPGTVLREERSGVNYMRPAVRAVRKSGGPR